MFEELKQKQSVMWGNGPYARITALLTESQENLVAALQPHRVSAGSTSQREPERSRAWSRKRAPT